MTMDILGFSTEPSAGGDFLPYIKYNAIAGQFQLVERVQGANGFESESMVLKRDKIKACIDMENLETGWLDFSGAMPQSHLVLARNLFHAEKNPDGIPFPPNPNRDAGWKEGVRLMLKLPRSVEIEDEGAHIVEKQVREMTSNAKAFTRGVAQLYRDYLEQVAQHPKMLPVVTVPTVILQKSGTSKSQAYQPQFKIVSWAPRPPDLIWKARENNAAAAAGNGQPRPANGQRPATGSRPATPPVASLADDFG
jgi:hypothetical protein